MARYGGEIEVLVQRRAKVLVFVGISLPSYILLQVIVYTRIMTYLTV